MPTDPTVLIRLAAIYLFALAGTAMVMVSSYLFVIHGALPDQLYTLLTGVIGASFTLVGFHSNTLAGALAQRVAEHKDGHATSSDRLQSNPPHDTKGIGGP